VQGKAGLSFDRLSVGLLFTALAFTACLIPAQADTFWHLRAGHDIWRTGHVPRVDTYSYTASGLPWPDHEWLWQAFSFALHTAGGMPFLTLGGAAVVMGAVTIVYRLMVGPTRTRFVLMVLAMPVASSVWALRPQIVTLLLLAVLLWALVHERLLVLPPLFVVWANTHGGVALGGYMLCAALGVALLRAWRGGIRDRRRAAMLAALVPVCALACAATPLGFGIYAFVVRLEWRVRQVHINEWLPAWPNKPVELVFWVLAAAFASLLVARRRVLRTGTWGDWVAVAVVAALLPLAFRAVRNIGPFLMLAPVAASRLLGAESWMSRPSTASGPDRRRLNAALLGGFIAAALAGVGFAWTTSPKRLGWHPLPGGVVEAVRACPDPLYNHYDEGGFLIWFLPERRVFVDSRQDPYPLPLLLEHLRVESGSAPYLPLFSRFGIRCAFLRVKSPTVERLQTDGWATRFRDATWAVLTAPAANGPSVTGSH
jgi:hypothetical protein